MLCDGWAALAPDELAKIEAAAPAQAPVTPKQPRKLLVFRLCNGYEHSSIGYWDRALQIMGKKTGAYEVVISDRMGMFMPQFLNQYDAVCLNNTTKLDFSDAKLRESLMDFVKGGKGLVGIHAASDNFYDWPEAAEMIGAQFSGHPWTSGGTWAIKVDDPEHPLTAAFGGHGFKIKDELYRTRPPFYSRSELRVLLSLDMTDAATRGVKGFEGTDVDTGISWIRSYGNGRVFYSSLGHNHDVVWNPAVLGHYLAGIQFALGDLPASTTPSLKADLDGLLGKVAGYEYGQSREPLSELTDIIRNSHAFPETMRQIEKRLLELLRSAATPSSKQFICRQLSVIGTEKSVTVLASMLTEKATSEIEPADMARYALERIPGEAADEALRSAMDKVSGTVKVGIINSIGNRGDQKAVTQLSGLQKDTDQAIAAAAFSALGKIGGKPAADALDKGKPKVDAESYAVWADSYLMCADKFLKDGDTESARRIYKEMYSKDVAGTIRAATLRGVVMTEPEKSTGIIMGALKSKDASVRASAASLLREIPTKEILKAVTEELSGLSTTVQVQVISSLADIGDGSVLPAVTEAAKSSEVEVRVAALDALGALGDVSSVGVLAIAATNTEGGEQQAARESLYRLRGEGVDEKILEGVAKAQWKMKVELIRSVAERNMTEGVDALLRMARHPQKEVRTESMRSLKVIAGPENLPALVGVLIYTREDEDRGAVEDMVAVVARKTEQENQRAGRILAILSSVQKPKARCSLLNVLGKIGDDTAVPTLVRALKDNDSSIKDAGIRALSEWPSDKPIDALLEAARSSDEAKHRVLALRGFIRMVGLDRQRPADETLRMYQEAMKLASETSEKKMVLSAVANMQSLGALEMAAGYLAESSLRLEAEAAVVRIADRTKVFYPGQTKGALEKVVEDLQNDSLREHAGNLIKQIKKAGAFDAGKKVELAGSDFSKWREKTGAWQIAGEAAMNPDEDKRLVTKAGTGVMVNGPDGKTVDIFSRAEFGDIAAHIEFMVPRGSNSGVYFMGRYEVQVFDSFGVEEPTYSDCGGIYQRWDDKREPKGYEGHPPRVNASRAPGEWQTFDVIFRAPQFDQNGNKTANARFEKVVHNGEVIHENLEVTGPTRSAAYSDERPTGPLMFQGDHGPVAYRNIRIVPLAPAK
jgi:type 1 glutamine amidotransferase/HEAT repeat protein